jgi:hypothetical protein
MSPTMPRFSTLEVRSSSILRALDMVDVLSKKVRSRRHDPNYVY